MKKGVKVLTVKTLAITTLIGEVLKILLGLTKNKDLELKIFFN